MNPTDVIIRYAELADVDAMVKLLAQLFSIEADFAVDENRQRKGLERMLAGCRKHSCIKVAEINRRVIGMCSAQILISTAEGGPVALLEDMVILPAWRRRDIGSRLLAAVESWARERGATRLQLLADRTNLSALKFYERLGWQTTRLICLRKT